MKVREILKKLNHPNFTCDICGRELFTGERFCAACYTALPWNNGEVCPLCGRKVLEKGICIECKQNLPIFDGARSAFTHEGEAARLVVRFKHGEKFLYIALSEALFPLVKSFDADSLCFVPMTEKAEKARGYNQSRVLAEELARKTELELLDCIEKTRESEEQKSLGGKWRSENLKGCFRVKDRKIVKGRRILLVDDTMTTGATANELASRLKRAGAEKVFLVTVTSVQYRITGVKN